jgi:transcriptional regulator with XRE-family HTH domain
MARATASVRGDGVRYLRLMRGLTQSQLAAAVGIRLTALAAIEHGKPHDPRILPMLLRYLGYTLRDLVVIEKMMGRPLFKTAAW